MYAYVVVDLVVVVNLVADVVVFLDTRVQEHDSVYDVHDQVDVHEWCEQDQPALLTKPERRHLVQTRMCVAVPPILA